MDWTQVVTGILALTGVGLSSWLGFRSIKAQERTKTETTRETAETEAYVRARKLDVETIERLERENAALRARVAELEARVKALEVKE